MSTGVLALKLSPKKHKILGIQALMKARIPKL